MEIIKVIFIISDNIMNSINCLEGFLYRISVLGAHITNVNDSSVAHCGCLLCLVFRDIVHHSCPEIQLLLLGIIRHRLELIVAQESKALKRPDLGF